MPTPASPPDARTASPPDAGPAPDRERQPIVALANRAARHAPGGALRTGLARGMMATTRKEQLALEVAADRLWGVTSPPTDGIRTLIGLADQGCVGASAMLASLGSPRSIRTLSVLVADESAPRLRRLAAIRGALVAWQASREQQLSTPVPLLAALRRAGREKDEQIRRLRDFQGRHSSETGPALQRLQAVARSNGNVFGELMSSVRVASLGQITKALYSVGGEYRRNL